MSVIQKDSFIERATAITLSNCRCCALLTKTNSNVPMYADELVFVKSNLNFRRLPACRQFCLHAEAPYREPVFFIKQRRCKNKFCLVCRMCWLTRCGMLYRKPQGLVHSLVACDASQSALVRKLNYSFQTVVDAGFSYRRVEQRAELFKTQIRIFETY